MHRCVTESIQDFLTPVCKIVRKLGPVSIGVNDGFKPTVGVILIARWLIATWINDLQQTMLIIVLEQGHITVLINHTHQVPIKVIGVPEGIPQRIGDGGDAAFRIPGEGHTLAG